MPVAIITGSAGLVGSEMSIALDQRGFTVVGIDNNMRAYFFGPDATTSNNNRRLVDELTRYLSHDLDIRDEQAVNDLFSCYSSDISLVVHTAAQPSHDWAAKEPFTDFSINANGTLNMLEATRQHCPDAVFIFTSTNKVYGDTPNQLPLIELDTRWEVKDDHPCQNGINEQMSIDQSKHSLFGASKVAADILVQEYGRYFGIKTGVFRGGCLTGPAHAGTKMHGFLNYLMRCIVQKHPYHILGYKGKQVRDNIHSSDLVSAFLSFLESPRCGEVYNIGGGRHSNCSVLEAIAMGEEFTGNKLDCTYSNENRKGDHIWYVSDMKKFKSHYPEWSYKYDQKRIIEEICCSLAI